MGLAEKKGKPRRGGVGMSSETQLRKGVLEMCVLHAVSQNKSHGYDIIRKMNGAFPEVSGSNIYAILRRLSAEGNVTMTHSDEGKGPTRKNYEITDSGRVILAGLTESWLKVKEAVEFMGVYSRYG
jgi:PadR family transcriptional regulator PadR